MHIPKLQKGFTLLEVLMVILIIALLMAFIVPQVLQGPAKARDVARVSHLNSLAVALESYLADNGKLPQQQGCLVPGTGAGGELQGKPQGNQIDPVSYISKKDEKFPLDPLQDHLNPGNCTGSYYYTKIDGTYEVSAKLESGKEYKVNGL